MREIKFRAWHKHTNKMFDLKTLTPLAVIDGMVDGLYIPFSKMLVLMQYTGLKRNGKEIYEGDIFKIENCWPVYVVVYAEEAATFGLKSRGGPFKPFTTVLRDAKDYPLSEVLGNIHENPELLEEAAADA